MSTRRNFPAIIFSAFALTTICLNSVAGTARIQTRSGKVKPSSIVLSDRLNLEFALQKGPEVVAGAPLKGVDVKLGKAPGGSPAARTTTDGDGKFNLGVVPAGTYFLIVEIPEGPEHPPSVTTIPGPQSAGADRKWLITIDGAVGGRTVRGWDPKTKKPVDLTSQSSAKAKASEKIILESNGHDPLTGICQTAVVRSKSNITNN